MSDTPRVTRRYGSPFPSYATRYRQPANWTVLRITDLLAGALLLGVWGATNDSATVLFVGLGVMLFKIVHRLARVERDICTHAGHTPYRPIPEVAEWKCRLCNAPLTGSPEDMALDEAARAVRDPRIPPQARYSDRR